MVAAHSRREGSDRAPMTGALQQVRQAIQIRGVGIPNRIGGTAHRTKLGMRLVVLAIREGNDAARRIG
jgi:hypothetical protein